MAEGVRLTFLGTSSGTPSRERNVSGLGLSMSDGALWLVDCGEGTQHQILKSDLKPGRLERVLLTHLHGDHCYGLFGLLASAGIHGRTAPVEIVGPRGVRELVEGVQKHTSDALPFPLSFVELDEGRDLGTHGGVRLEARAIAHRVPCFGYVLHGPSARHLDATKARALGVQSGPLFGELARGVDVTLPDGRVVKADEVTGPEERGFHLVVLGDTHDPSGIAEAAHGCDALVHEATYQASRTSDALRWGHSTTHMAAAFAKRVQAKQLVLTHFSARYHAATAPFGVADLVREAETAAPGLPVVAAYDFMSLEVRPG